LNASFVGLGAGHSCAGATGGTLYCWGANASFQVDNSRQDQDQPRDVSSNFSAIGGGLAHTCGVRGGGVTCWGLNDMFQLGVTSAGSDPVDVVGLSSAVIAVAAGSRHTCAIQNGNVWCWGMNDSGQLGQSTGGAPSATPLHVSGL
jgi:alpha-tubulin suppressor-like RCC1 family protein